MTGLLAMWRLGVPLLHKTLAAALRYLPQLALLAGALALGWHVWGLTQARDDALATAERAERRVTVAARELARREDAITELEIAAAENARLRRAEIDALTSAAAIARRERDAERVAARRAATALQEAADDDPTFDACLARPVPDDLLRDLLARPGA